MQFDPDARYEAATKSWAHSEMVDVGESYADGACLAGLTAVTWGYGALAGNDRLRETGWYMAKGLVLDAVIVTALKSAVGRTRPDGSDTRSFPSGHTSTAFTTATVLSRRHGWKIGLPAYGLASMAAVARIEDDRHYLSDVVAGAVLGIAVGKFITPKSKPEESGWQVVASPSKVGLRLKF
jgi:membrane-associated phospholipid phosphatase